MGLLDKYLIKNRAGWEEEKKFQKAYKEMAVKMGLSLDSDDPRHQYDWRGLYKETGKLEADATGHFDSKHKLEGHKNLIVDGINTKTGEAVEPKPYQPINFDEFLNAPSTEEISQNQETIFNYEKDYEEISLAIDTNYELYKDYTKQLDDLETELQEAPPDLQFSLNQKYNEIRDQHNVLVEKLQKDTKRQKEIYEEYTKLRTTFDKDIEIYNRWAKAQNEKEPEPFPLGKGEMSKPEDRPDPTWGQAIYHSLRAGLGSANANFWNIGRMLEMGKIKAEEKIDDLFFPGAKDRNKKFEEKYGKDPNFSLPLDVLTHLVEDAEAIEAESAPQAESKNWLKQSLSIGLRPVPQIVMSIGMGAAMPIATGGVQTLAARTTADFMKSWLRMTPFGTMAGTGKAREIEKRYEELGEEAPYMKMLLAGAVTGVFEMATEMPVYFGVMNIISKGGLGVLVNSGAKAFIDKYGFQVFTNILLQGVQEGEMAIAGEAINKAFGEPDEWNLEGLTENVIRDTYGGLCMGVVMLGLGGGVSGSMAVANKTKRAIDRFVKDEDDIKTTLRKILEYQGIIMEEAEIEALAYEAKEEEEIVYWHGTPSGDLKGSYYGLHIGTKKAAEETLYRRIGIPADGKGWTGNREYGKTLLAGKETLKEKGIITEGFNLAVPEKDFYVKEGMAKFSTGLPISLKSKPTVIPVKIKGEMVNTPSTSMRDNKANSIMQGQITKGRAKRGYYYENDVEDEGSISAVVPNKEHLIIVPEAKITEPKAPKYKVPKDFHLGKPSKVGDYIRQDINAGNVGIGHIAYKVKGKMLYVDMIRIDVESLKHKGYAGSALAQVMAETGTFKQTPTEDGFSKEGREFTEHFFEARGGKFEKDIGYLPEALKVKPKAPKIKPMGETFKKIAEEQNKITEAIKKKQPVKIPVYDGMYKKVMIDGDLFYTRDNKNFLTERQVAQLVTPEFAKEILKVEPKAPTILKELKQIKSLTTEDKKTIDSISDDAISFIQKIEIKPPITKLSDKEYREFRLQIEEEHGISRYEMLDARVFPTATTEGNKITFYGEPSRATFWHEMSHILPRGKWNDLAKKLEAEAKKEALKTEPKAPTTLKLFHLSTEQQLKEIDPEYMGKGQAGREMARVGEEGFEKTSAWYTEETPKVEPRFFGDMLYTTEIEAKDIYNWKENPENLKTHSEIKEAGYKGYKIDDQVRLFEKVEVVREGIPIAEKGEEVAIKDIAKLIAPLKKISDISDEIAGIHNEKGGSTYNLYDGNLIGKEKYAVSVYPDIGIVVNKKKITPAIISKFIKDNINLLKNPANSVGTWYDKDDKKTYIDVSKTVDTLEEAIKLGKEYKQKEIFNLKTEESIPVIKSLEDRLKEALTEIKKLKGILKTVKGNVEKRAEFKKQLMEYIRKNMPYSVQNKMLATMKNVSGQKALEKAMQKVDEYTFIKYRKQYIKAIENELKAKKIKPKRAKSGMLKGRFVPVIQDKLDFVRANINNSRAKALEKIQENIELFNRGKAINIAEENELLNMVGIKEMDLETLQSTLANIKELKKEGRTLKGQKDAKNRERHENDRADTIESITGKEVKRDEETGEIEIDSSYKTIPKTKKMGWIKTTIDKIVNWQFGWDNLLDKLSFLHKTSKPYESPLSKIGDSVHYARVGNMTGLENVLTLVQVKFAEAFEAKSKKEITQITRKLREEIGLGTFKNSKGDKVHFILNKEQIMKKYMQLDDPTLEATFDEGMLYTEEIKDAIRGALSKEEIAWTEAVKEVYDYMWERINPIFEEMYGIHFPYNPFYSGTIRRDVDLDIPEASLLAQDAFKFASILNPSLKTRSKTKQSLEYDEMTSSLMNYVMQMEHFINWAKPLNDLRSVFGDKRVKSVINGLYGQDVLTKVNGFLDDMTRDGVDKAKIIKWVDTIRFNFTRSILAKPHIGLKQIPSVLAYMTEMPVQDFFNGVGNFWKNPIKNYRYLVAHSAYARARFGEGFERDIHGAMQSDYVHLLSHTHKISDMTMGMVRAGDKFAVMQGMWAKFYSETKGQTTKAKNAEEAIRRAEIVTQRTQPSFTVESLATGQRGGSLLKLFTMFQNQPNKYFRIISDNARNFRAGRGSRVKTASNMVLAWAVLPMLFQFIGDGGKWITRHQLRALVLGIFNDILVFGSMIRGMYGWLVKEAYDVQASPVFATLREIEYCLAKIAKWKDPDKDLTPEDIQAFTEHFAKAFGQLMGLPTPYGVQVKKAIQSGDYRQLLFSEYILGLSNEEKKKAKKPYVKSGDKYTKYLKGKYKKPSKYSKYLKY